jgi:hypothetical protein
MSEKPKRVFAFRFGRQPNCRALGNVDPGVGQPSTVVEARLPGVRGRRQDCAVAVDLSEPPPHIAKLLLRDFVTTDVKRTRPARKRRTVARTTVDTAEFRY